MHCEDILCIFNQDLSCERDEIHIGDKGLCNSYLTVSVPDEFLALLKEKHHKRLKILQEKIIDNHITEILSEESD